MPPVQRLAEAEARRLHILIIMRLDGAFQWWVLFDTLASTLP